MKELNGHFALNSLLLRQVDPTLPRFRDIAGFLLKTASDSTLFHPNFRGVLLTRLTMLGSETRRLQYSYLCSYFRSNPTRMTTKSPTSQTDRQTTYNGNTGTAICTYVHCAVKMSKAFEANQTKMKTESKISCWKNDIGVGVTYANRLD